MRARLRTPAVLLLLASVAACADEEAPLPSDPSPPGPVEAVLGLAQEDDLFSFLPPLSSPRTFQGVFNPDLRPSIVICDTADPTCTNDDPTDDTPLVTIAGDDVSVDPDGELYQYDWRTGSGNPAARPVSGVVYRIHVVVRSVVVGFHDVLPTDGGRSGGRDPNLHTFRNGSTLPIKFRIDVGAICQPDGEIVVDCDEAVIDLNAGGIVAVEQGGVEFKPGTATGNGDDFVLVIVEQLNEENPDVNCFEAAPGGGLDVPQFGPCIRITTDPEIDGLNPLAVVSLCIEPNAPLPITELQEELIQIHKIDEGTGAVLALENVAENICDAGDQVGLLEGLPDHPLLRYASLGWRSVKRVVLPRPLVAADIGFGGGTPGFSNFRWALPAKLNPLPGTDDQVASAGTAVPNDPGVLVLDGYGDPVQGATVRFTVVDGGGAVAAAVAVTGADGIASSQGWTLGTVPGANTLTAGGLGYQAALDAQSHHFELDVDPEAVVFTATGVAVHVGFHPNDGGHQGDAPPGHHLPLVVTVVDANGNGVPGVDVTWVVTDGGGSFGGQGTTVVTSLPDGTAPVTWTLGGTVSPHGTPNNAATATVTLPDGHEVTVTFTATTVADHGHGGDGGHGH